MSVQHHLIHVHSPGVWSGLQFLQFLKASLMQHHEYMLDQLFLGSSTILASVRS